MPLTREERAEIARRNGAKSKGPKSDAGKAVSRTNGLKHGRRAKQLLQDLALGAVPDVENLPVFQRILNQTVRQLGPGTYAELSLATNIAADDWRIQRWNKVESTMIDMEFRRLERLAEEAGSGESADEILAQAAESLASKQQLIQYLDGERRRLLRSRAQSLKLLNQLQEGPKRIRRRRIEAISGRLSDLSEKR